MSEEGWIKLHRRLVKNPIFTQPKLLTVFLYLLLSANHETRTIFFNRQEVTVERGCIITGRRKIAEKTNLSEQNVRWAVQSLMARGIVRRCPHKSTNRFSYLSICNYNEYQEKTNDNQPTNQPAEDQPTASQQPASNHKQELRELKELQEEDKECGHTPAKPIDKTLLINIKDIFEHWVSLPKPIVKHRSLTPKMDSSIRRRLKDYQPDEIKYAMTEYQRCLASPEHFVASPQQLHIWLDRYFEEYTKDNNAWETKRRFDKAKATNEPVKSGINHYGIEICEVEKEEEG